MIDNQADRLNSFFNQFNINAKCVRNYTLGKVTCYDVELSGFEKVKNIQKYSSELALFMRHGSSPEINLLLDSGLIRIEFTNTNQKFVNFKVNNSLFSKEKINCYLGENNYGEDVNINLQDNPHLIIAGCTGSGKSSALHTIINNVIVNTCDKLYLLDPKASEFEGYKKNKRCIVGNTYKDAVRFLEMMHHIMETNFDLIKIGVSANSLPSTVLVIDEFADFIFQDKNKEFYNKLCTLAQKCRAAKIHIVIATQRPSSKIIDGTIKANFPSRLACKVTSQIESKIILDTHGAEKLVGKGDAILKLQNGTETRLQLAYSDHNHAN